MSKKFHAVNRKTGKKWEPELDGFGKKRKQWLMMYDTGSLAVVENDFYMYVTPLSNKDWEIVLH